MGSLYGRAVIDVMTNKSGGALAKGDVVIVDTSNDRAVTTTTTGATTRPIGVVIEENGIANNATGRVQFGGYTALVNVPASVTRGDYLVTHTVAKQATGRTMPANGAFGTFLKTSTTPDALLFGFTNRSNVELTYNQITSGVSPTATSEATADTVVTASAVACDGASTILIEFWAFSARPRSDASGGMSFWLYDDAGGGAASIGRIGFLNYPATGADNKPVHLLRRLTPSAASHTFSIRASVSAGTGNIGAGAGGSGADGPAFIRITLV